MSPRLCALLLSSLGSIDGRRLQLQGGKLIGFDSISFSESMRSTRTPRSGRRNRHEKRVFSDDKCFIGDPKQTGTLSDVIEESSGLSCSLTKNGVCYTHNDSQDKARIFAIDTSGKLLAEIHLEGIRARDWEDIAIAGNHIYIGDIGDNRGRKKTKTIHRIEEPDLRGTSPGAVLSVVAESFTFDMPEPEGGQNAEGMFVDPSGRTLYIITKTPDRGETNTAKGKLILKVTWGDSSSAKYVGQLWHEVSKRVTGAEMSSDGSMVAVRTYAHLYVWKVSRDAPERALGKRPCGSLYHKEKQSEAIGFSADGRRLYTTSEGVGLPMWEYQLGKSQRANAKKLDSSPGPNGKGKPLRDCQGDCDKDSDCAGDRVCFQRDGYAPVPGCAGRGRENFDYCIPTLKLDSSPGKNGNGKPLRACQGDCDKDSDCAGDLVCFQRDGYAPVQGCEGRGRKDFDYCVHA